VFILGGYHVREDDYLGLKYPNDARLMERMFETFSSLGSG
jgi:hypothetical protein